MENGTTVLDTETRERLKRLKAMTAAFAPTPFVYEDQLINDSEWALREGSLHFEQKSAVQATLRKITARLADLHIDYAVVGGMALFQHGFRRFTEDVDILVTREGLKILHAQLEGRGYVPPFAGSKNLRDAEFGVRIEFLIAGEYPGDGKPKPVAFPDPATVAIERDNIRYLALPALIELKLASGITGAGRIKDLADVQELIKMFALPQDYQNQLNPYVRGKYLELWQSVTTIPARYISILQTAIPLPQAHSLTDLLALLPEEAVRLTAMQQAGVVFDPERSRPEKGYFVLATHDAEVAQAYGLHTESEVMYEE